MPLHRPPIASASSPRRRDDIDDDYKPISKRDTTVTATQKIVTPVDGSVYAERPLATGPEIDTALARAAAAQKRWKQVSVAERAQICTRFVDAFVAKRDEIALELSWQMGRPVAQAPGEVRGFEERARHMISIAEQSLANVDPGPKPGFERFIKREALGTVFVVGAWNFPYLITVNAVVPAIMAGNAVILKQASQTLLCAERFAEAFKAAGLPEGVFQALHLGIPDTEALMSDTRVDFIAFTGSVPVGHTVQRIAAERFIGVGLELGGCDPAYVRADADLGHAVENLVDGAFFNSGQSCCGIQRIYVHETLYDRFVEGAAELVRGYRLGNPIAPETNLGPVVRASAATELRKQIETSIAQGAKPLIDPKHFAADAPGTAYLAPQVLVNVDHSMEIMTNEVFGPACGIMKVASDEEAVRLMNDSAFGLTAAIWTADVEAAKRLGNEIETGTLFMNRCDYLDPALAWVGVKDSGRGCTLSSVGYEHLTRPKSFHLRTAL
jgi:acyl-CoA reductase-like NAD-dependent aldehyde dehydrogenase